MRSRGLISAEFLALTSACRSGAGARANARTGLLAATAAGDGGDASPRDTTPRLAATFRCPCGGFLCCLPLGEYTRR
jgi:hypothetical protein